MAEINECFPNVRSYIDRHGGGIQYGWINWESLNVFLQAELHAVWVSDVGEYVDITPKTAGEYRILFLPDSERVYEGQLVENRRKPLVYTKWTWWWMWHQYMGHLLRLRHFRDGKVDLDAANAELAETPSLQEEGSTPEIKLGWRLIVLAQGSLLKRENLMNADRGGLQCPEHYLALDGLLIPRQTWSGAGQHRKLNGIAGPQSPTTVVTATAGRSSGMRPSA